MEGNAANDLNELPSGLSLEPAGGHLDFGLGKRRAENPEQPVLSSDLQNRKILDLCCFKSGYDLGCFKCVLLVIGVIKN